jgi:hypothetical protein
MITAAQGGSSVRALVVDTQRSQVSSRYISGCRDRGSHKMSTYECKIDVENLVAEIMHDISEKGYTRDDVTFSDVQVEMLFGTIKRSDKLAENIFMMHFHHNVPAYWDLRKTSKGKLGLLLVPLKRIMRKLMSFYIEPIVEKQNLVNEHALISLEELYFDGVLLKNRAEVLEEENKRLRILLHDSTDKGAIG